MKVVALIFLLFVTTACVAQKGSANFYLIDWKAQSIEADAADTLAKKLTGSYTTDLEKVRAIFSWITGNIDYQVKPRYNRPGKSSTKYLVEDPSDTASILKPLNERVADLVIRRKEAFCDGYAKLFKTLCDFSGIKAEIIIGYARTGEGMDKAGRRFRSNHSWNAVFIDSTWHLLDVTWASGFLTYRDNEFMRRYNNRYFLTPPQDFIDDHYPEDLRWTLLPQPPAIREFSYSPFKQIGFVHSNITSYSPEKGVIDAAIGDTIRLVLSTNVKEEYPVSQWDTITQPFAWLYIKPTSINNGTLSYTYTVQSQAVEWLNLVYNDEVLMRYRINIKKPETAKE